MARATSRQNDMGDWVTQDDPEPEKEYVDDGLDDALASIGGPRSSFTWKVFLLTSLSGVINIWVIISWVFLAHDVDFRCRIPELDYMGWTHEQQKNITLADPSGPACEVLDMDYTKLINHSYEDALGIVESSKYINGTRKCMEYIFKANQTSIVQEFNLVCDRLHLKSDIQMVVALGKLTGSFIFGIVADKYGRKIAFMLASIAFMVFGPIQAFVPSYWFMTMSRFVSGLASSGCYYSGVTLTLEIVRSDWRDFFGILYNMSYAVGYVTLASIAYFIRTWSLLQMSLSFPAFLLIFSCLFLPESPKWLATKGIRSRAWEIVQNVDPKRKPTVLIPDAEPEPDTPEVNFNCFKNFENLILYSDMRWRLLIAIAVWSFVALGYYTIALNSENFSADRFVYVAVSGIVEASCYVVPIPLLRHVGRRGTSCLLLSACGIALVVIPLIPDRFPALTLSVAMLGRLCNGAVYAVIVLFTSELFPTSDRSTAVGVASTMSHVGGILAPYIVVNAAAHDKRIPGYTCAVASFVAAYLVLLYPETRGKRLRDTVEQMREDAKYGEKVSCSNPCTVELT